MRNAFVVPTAALALLVAAPAPGQGTGKDEYQAARRTIESDFRTARLGCEPMLGNVRTICMADVRGREAVALAELVARHQSTEDARTEVRIVKARAGLALARARCDDAPPPRKSLCLAEARAAHEAALAGGPLAGR